MNKELLSQESFFMKAQELQLSPEKHLEAIGLPLKELNQFTDNSQEAFNTFITSGNYDEEIAKFRFGYETRKKNTWNFESGKARGRENGLAHGVNNALTMINFRLNNIVPADRLIEPDDEFRSNLLASYPEVIDMKRGIIDLALKIKSEKGDLDRLVPEDINSKISDSFVKYWDRTEVIRI